MEATAGIEPAIKVLQTSALPLGYVTTIVMKAKSNTLENYTIVQ
jgi:hypothetical protein